MLLRSVRATEKNFGSRLSRKQSNFALRQKREKTFPQAHKALGLNNLNSFTNMVAKINILNSCTNVIAKINIRVFQIQEQLRLKFGKKLRTASLDLIFIGSYEKKV